MPPASAFAPLASDHQLRPKRIPKYEIAYHGLVSVINIIECVIQILF
jgi:hypothetical protein